MVSRPGSFWLLLASLSLNVFLVAAIAVGVAWPGFRSPPPPDPMKIADDMASGLPPADAGILRQAFATRAAAFERARDLHVNTPARIRRVLEQAEFDAAALGAIFAEARTAHEAMDAAIEMSMTEAIGKMSPAGRRKLAEWEPPGRRGP